MKRSEYILRLLENHNGYNYPMPIFHNESFKLSIRHDKVYDGFFEIVNNEKDEFSCYIEAVKGIVHIKESWAVGRVIRVQYTIDAKKLQKECIYEEEVRVYYVGGMSKIHFSIQIIDFLVRMSEDIVKSDEEGIKAKVDIKKTKELEEKANEALNKKREKQKKQSVENMFFLSFSKKTYMEKEPIKVRLQNTTGRLRKVIMIVDDEYITPSVSEIFLNDTVELEFYVKANAVHRFFGRTPFRKNPMHKVLFSVYDGETEKLLHESMTIITPFSIFPTKKRIKNEEEEKIFQEYIYRQYIMEVTKQGGTKKYEEIGENIKALMNYNQEDSFMRVLYIFNCIETKDFKAAKEGLLPFQKYSQYYEEQRISSVCVEALGQLVEAGGKKKRLSLDIYSNCNKRLAILMNRFCENKRMQYENYRKFYHDGCRSGLLFAEVTHYIIEQPFVPAEQDKLYANTLKWAINHKVVDKDWLTKLERSYYLMIRGEILDSYFVYELFRSKKTRNFMKCFCELAIKEQRTDYKAFYIYHLALKKKIYIEGIEEYYIKAGYETNSMLDVEAIVLGKKVSELHFQYREYYYQQVMTYADRKSAVFKRVYKEVLSYLIGTPINTKGMLQIVESVFDDVVENDIDKINMIIGETTITYANKLQDNTFMKKISYVCFQNKVLSAFAKNKKKQVAISEIEKTIAQVLGYENMYRHLSKADKKRWLDEYYFPLITKKMMYFFHKREKENKQNLFWLPMYYYEKIFKENDKIFKIYTEILQDKNPITIFSWYNSMEDKKQKIVASHVFAYMSRKVFIDDVEIAEEIFEAMHEYYIEISLIDKSTAMVKSLLIALLKAMEQNNYPNVLKQQQLLNDAANMKLVMPWDDMKVDADMNRVIYYYVNPAYDVYIHYRYEDVDFFQKEKLKHLAFGLHIFKTKLFYLERLEYYITVEKEEKVYLKQSNIIRQEELAGFLDGYKVDERMNSIMVSHHMGDEISVRELMKEQIQFEKDMETIGRL